MMSSGLPVLRTVAEKRRKEEERTLLLYVSSLRSSYCRHIVTELKTLSNQNTIHVPCQVDMRGV